MVNKWCSLLVYLFSDYCLGGSGNSRSCLVLLSLIIFWHNVTFSLVDLWTENSTLYSWIQSGVYRNPEMSWVETAIHEASVDSSTLPASNVERTRASLNNKATTKPNYLILLSSLLFLPLVGRYSDSRWAGTFWGSNPDGGRDFPPPSRPALESTQPPVQCVPGFFPVGEAAGAWGWPPTPI